MIVLGMEHKTTSDEIGMGSIYWEKLTLDAQISNYLVGLRALGYDPRGMLYDVLRKPSIAPALATPRASRKYTKDGRLYASQRADDETPAEYEARLLAEIAERPDRYYQRGVIIRLDAEQRDAAYDLWSTAEQVRASRAAGRWTRNVDACTAYHRLCEFWPICSGATTEADGRYETGRAHRELSAGIAVAADEDASRRSLPLLTTSAARAYRSCPRKYWLAYERGLRPRAEAPALRFGTRVHAALEAWLAPERSLDAALAALGTTPDPYEDARARAMVIGYHARWESDRSFAVLATEREFIAPLRNPDTGAASRTFALGGKIDAIVERGDF